MLYRGKRRRGAVIVLVAICLTAMLGIVAIALDGGLLLDQRRRLQSAADAAALAAAIDLYKNYSANNGLDKNGTAKASALSVAAANGYNNDGTNSIVTVNIPPSSGSYANKPGYAEAIIQYNQQRGFSNIFGSGNIPVTARAVARGLLKPLDKGIILLDPTSQGSLNAVGNAAINVTSGAIIVDSNSPAGGTLVGNANITAPTVDFSGSPGYSVSGNAQFGPGTTLASNQPPALDPLAYLQQPTPSSLPLQSSSTLNISQTPTAPLNPGLYIGGIKISGQANVTMNPGIYYMQGGGFSDTGQGSLVGNGVMIYNDGSGSINIAGQGTVTLTPPTSGPYQGITLFQNRTSSQTISVTGNGNMNITGTFYAANALLKITGNGTGNNIGSQYVSYDLKVTGNGDVNITYESSSAPKIRVIGLVE